MTTKTYGEKILEQRADEAQHAYDLAVANYDAAYEDNLGAVETNKRRREMYAAKQSLDSAQFKLAQEAR